MTGERKQKQPQRDPKPARCHFSGPSLLWIMNHHDMRDVSQFNGSPGMS